MQKGLSAPFFLQTEFSAQPFGCFRGEYFGAGKFDLTSLAGRIRLFEGSIALGKPAVLFGTLLRLLTKHGIVVFALSP